MSESEQYMHARDDCYEPDWEGYEPDDEELAYELYKQRQLEGYRIEYAYTDRHCCLFEVFDQRATRGGR